MSLLLSFLFISWWGHSNERREYTSLTSSFPSSCLQSPESPVKKLHNWGKSDPSQPGSTLSAIVNSCACFRVSFKSLIGAKRFLGFANPGERPQQVHNLAGPAHCWPGHQRWPGWGTRLLCTVKLKGSTQTAFSHFRTFDLTSNYML